ncbi:alcohol dehydrogenase catalytic domain-containing protein [Streptomyces sp. NPDC051576]|uniref:zinc-binding dehydrogenase n=1 Tax=Streptomyces sp. NPDC051576 TaxID=3155803 RepID=UPI003417929C
MIRTGPHPLTGAESPLALGHEFSGTVFALGSEVPGFEIGDRVTADPVWSCGTCYWCVRAEYHICPRSGSVGLASPGAFAERVTVPLAGLTRLPDNVTDEMAALAEPLAVGLHAVTWAGVRPGDNVLVVGGGPIGFAVVLAARLAGAAGLFVSEPLKGRREELLDLGVTEAFDPRKTDVRREVFLRTGRIGPDVVIDATGVASLAAQAVTTVRRGGRVVLAGVGHGSVEVDMGQLVFYERSVLGTLGYNFDIPPGHRPDEHRAPGRLGAADRAVFAGRRCLGLRGPGQGPGLSSQGSVDPEGTVTWISTCLKKRRRCNRWSVSSPLARSLRTRPIGRRTSSSPPTSSPSSANSA